MFFEDDTPKPVVKDPGIFQDQVVKSLDDIKRLLATIKPSTRPTADVAKSTAMVSVGTQIIAVPVTSESLSRRETILRCMTELRAKSEKTRPAQDIVVNGRSMRPISADVLRVRHGVDDLLKRWLGAFRDGLAICWDIDGYTYKYDIFTHSLVRDKNAPGECPS